MVRALLAVVCVTACGPRPIELPAPLPAPPPVAPATPVAACAEAPVTAPDGMSMLAWNCNEDPTRMLFGRGDANIWPPREVTEVRPRCGAPAHQSIHREVVNCGPLITRVGDSRDSIELLLRDGDGPPHRIARERDLEAAAIAFGTPSIVVYRSSVGLIVRSLGTTGRRWVLPGTSLIQPSCPSKPPCGTSCVRTERSLGTHEVVRGPDGAVEIIASVTTTRMRSKMAVIVPDEKVLAMCRGGCDRRPSCAETEITTEGSLAIQLWRVGPRGPIRLVERRFDAAALPFYEVARTADGLRLTTNTTAFEIPIR